jgi:protein-S-isoprenylcysteine O-methyltransferase Ste14
MTDWLPISMFGCIAISAIAANALKNATLDELKFVKDDRTILIFRILMPASVILALALSQIDPWVFVVQNSWLDWIAGFLFVFGLSLRWIAIGSLKRAFTVKVTILKDHQLKTDGVYRWVRHPSYTGMYIYGLGYGLALNSPLCMVLVLLAVWISTYARIPVEEAVLESHFGEAYINYKSKTWRLFPGLY